MSNPRVARQLLNLDLFTDAYRITGRAGVGVGGIHAELGNPTSNMLPLEDAYISRINQPGEILASYNKAAIRKENVNFIILQNRRDGIPMSAQGASVFTRGQAVEVFITVPSFEIRGEIHHSGKFTPREMLAQAVGNFLLVFSAKASASLYPDIDYTGDLFLVHKDRVGILCLGDFKR